MMHRAASNFPSLLSLLPSPLDHSFDTADIACRQLRQATTSGGEHRRLQRHRCTSAGLLPPSS